MNENEQFIMDCPCCNQQIKIIKSERNGEYISVPFLVEKDNNYSPAMKELSDIVGIELGIGGE